MTKFLTTIEREGLKIAWEPRGDWKENAETLRYLCKDHNIIHVVDLMRYEPISDQEKA